MVQYHFASDKSAGYRVPGINTCNSPVRIDTVASMVTACSNVQGAVAADVPHPYTGKGGDDGVVRVYDTSLKPWSSVQNVTVYTIASHTFPQSIRSV
jgi:V8-like Glu-specific endopeptidase